MIKSENKHSLVKPLDCAIFVLLSVCILLPIWIVRYPAAADYWNHLLKAKIVADYSDPTLGYSKFYQISFLPIPNMVSTLAMALLMKLFAPMIAGKLFLSLYAIGLPLSARYLVRSADCKFQPLENIGFAVVYNPCFWDGYIDFCLSVVIAQFAIGYWLRMRDHVRTKNAAVYISLMLLTYFAHFWGFVVLMGITMLLAIRESRSKRFLWIGSAAIAGALLFIYSHGASERLSIQYAGVTYTLSLARNFLILPRLAGQPADFAHLASAGILIAMRLALFVVMLVLAARQKNRLFWIGMALLISFFLLPNQLGRMREPGQRTLVFIPAILAAAIAVYPTKRTARALSLLIVSCTLFTVLFTAQAWIAKDRDLAIYHKALARIPAHSRVLNVVTIKSSPLQWPWKLLGSDMYRSENWFGANYNLEKGGFYLHTFTTGVVKVRDHASPIEPWFIMESSFEWTNWLRANRATIRRSFDYIVVVGHHQGVADVLLADFTPCRELNGCLLMTNRTIMHNIAPTY